MKNFINKEIILIVFSVFIYFHAKAQQERIPSYSYSFKTSDSTKIYYTHENADFNNTYTLYKTLKAAVPFCTIKTYYDEYKEDIVIIINEKGKDVKVRINYPIKTNSCIVKNNQLYDTIINDKEKYWNLITMPELSKSLKIFINQISSNDSIACYKLYPIRKRFYVAHIDSCKTYFKRKDDNRTNSDNERIFDIVKKETIRITEDCSDPYERFLENKTSFRNIHIDANENLQQDFKFHMNQICLGLPFKYNYTANITYYVVIDPRNNKLPEIGENTSIKVNANKQDLVEITNKISERSIPNPNTNLPLQNNLIQPDPKDTLQAWVKKYLDKNIKELDLKTETTTVGEILDYDFYNTHKMQIDTLKIPNYNKEQMLSFLTGKIKEINTKSDREVDRPTDYIYNAYINSSIEKHKLIFKNEKVLEKGMPFNGYDFPKNTLSVQHGYPYGRYLLKKQVIRLNNNDSLKKESYWTPKRKYIFLTHYGASFGFFINKGFKIDSIGNHNYVDLFFIRHHMGLFLGGSFWGAFDQYYEGGLYVGPTNYLFFKIGLASANIKNIRDVKTSALLGVSLIFPVIHFEGGYNFALKAPYVMLGLNIPVNN
jgi:hypothetical protein